jgi:hypothetical protein
MRYAILLTLAFAGCGADPVGSLDEELANSPNGPADAHVRYQGGKASPTGGLIDHGGKLLPVSHTYAIWWGDPTAFPADASDLESMLAGLDGSRYLAIADQYMRGGTTSTTFVGSYSDTSAPPSHGPKTSTIVAEACKIINASGLAADPTALYAVFTSNFPSQINYCAWHSHGTCNNVDIQVAYLPSGTGIAGCDPFASNINLNCNTVSQYTRSIGDSLAHEFMETVTDPDINAWLDKNGAEVADKCEFKYQACVTLGGIDWQIQEEWSNATGGCVQGN